MVDAGLQRIPDLLESGAWTCGLAEQFEFEVT